MTCKHPLKTLSAAVLAASSLLSPLASADFMQDATARLELRNMYLDRDFKDLPVETRQDWAQGITLRFQSGWTEGPLGLGLDALSQTGIRLDSGKGRSGTGVTPVDRFGDPEETWSELGLTLKAKVSNSTLKLGTLQQNLPVLLWNDTRLLGGTYTGGLLEVKEIEGLTLHAARITEVNHRDSTSRDDMGYVYNGAESDHLDLVGGSYQFTPDLTASYYYGGLDEVYDQHFLGLVHKLPLGEGLSLSTDLRYFDTEDSGKAVGGKIDNRFFNGMFTLAAGAHKLGLGFQRLSGDGNFPFVKGGDPYSVNLVTYNIFTKQETDAWQLRYDYDFAALGVPGLGLMARYVKADDIHTAATDNGTEWERDTDVFYTFQDGSLKGLNIRLRNAVYRSGNGLTGGVNENRVLINYSIPLL